MLNAMPNARSLTERSDVEITITDPVCGKQLDLGQAVAHEEDGGWAYFFCSSKCHQLFLASPKRYLGDRPKSDGSRHCNAERNGRGG